jgi:DNA-directed RNA polymerase subunit F
MDKRTAEETGREVEQPDPKKVKEFVEKISEDIANGDLGSATGFLPQTKIEVLWTLHSEGDENNEEAEGTDIWWQATVVGRTSRLHELPKNEDEEDEPGSLDRLPVYEIRYDPMLPDFPNPQLSAVCILDDHQLLDTEAEDNPTLPWRMLGSDWEEEDGDSDKLELPDNMKDLVDRFGASPADGGAKLAPEVATAMASSFVESLIESLTSKHASELGNLPRSNQNQIVDKVMRIKEMLVEKLACKLTSTGVVSEEDAKSIVEELKAA